MVMMKDLCLMAINMMNGTHWTEFDFRQSLLIFNLHLCPRTPRLNRLLCPSLDIETKCFVTHATMFDRQQIWVKEIILLRWLCYQQRNSCLWQEPVISLPKFIENRQLPSLVRLSDNLRSPQTCLCIAYISECRTLFCYCKKTLRPK